MTRQQVNFMIGAVCVVVVLLMGLVFYLVKSLSTQAAAQVAASLSQPTEAVTVMAPMIASAPAPHSASVAPMDGHDIDSSVLSQMMSLSIMGTPAADIEQWLGQGQFEGDGRQHYRVEGCDVGVHYRNGRVANVSLLLSEQCVFELSDIGVPEELSSRGLTFGQLNQALQGGLHFQADCLTACGNAADPVVSSHYKAGAGQTNGLPRSQIVASVTLVDGQALEAAEHWEGEMTRNEGQPWVMEAQFNCTDAYDGVAATAFANVHIEHLAFGESLAWESCAAG